MTNLKLTAPNGLEINGTLERVCGRAECDSFYRDEFGNLTPNYGGYTEIFWEEQESVEQNGKTVYLDTDGNQWTEDQLTITELAA